MAKVCYTFVASGHREVAKAIGDITTAAEKNAAAMRHSGQVAQQTAQRSRRDARAWQQEYVRGKRPTEAPGEQVARNQEKAAKRRSATIASGERQDAAESRKRRASTRREETKALESSVRATEASGREKLRALKRHAADEAAIERRAAKATARAQADRRQAWRNFGDKAVTAGVLGIGIAGAVAARYTGRAVRENWDLEAQAAGIATRGSLGAKRLSTGAVARQLQETAAATPGVKAEDIGAGVQAFITKIGKGKEAMGFRNIMATMASATGGRAEDIGSTMADLYSKFGITKKGEMQDILARLHVQGKTGAFELQDFAKYAPRVFSAARVFGAEKGVEGAATIGGLMQMIRGTVGSGAQAATGVENMLQTLIKKSAPIKQKLGVSVFDKEGKARKLPDILAEIAAAGKGDVRATAGIFTERGQKAMNAFLLKFKELKDEGKSSADALKALKTAIQDAIDAPGAWEESLRDAAQNQDTMAARLTAAWEGFKLAISKDAGPAINSFVTALTDSGLAPAVASFVGAIASGAGDIAKGFMAIVGYLKDKLGTGPTELEKERAAKKKKAEEELATAMKALVGPRPLGTAEEEVDIGAKAHVAISAAREKLEQLQYTEGGEYSPMSPEAFMDIATKKLADYEDAMVLRDMALGGERFSERPWGMGTIPAEVESAYERLLNTVVGSRTDKGSMGRAYQAALGENVVRVEGEEVSRVLFPGIADSAKELTTALNEAAEAAKALKGLAASFPYTPAPSQPAGGGMSYAPTVWLGDVK